MSEEDATTPDTPSGGAVLLMQPFVDFEEISFKEKVGHGSYGVVYKAVWRERYVAVKEFEASADQKAIETEVKQLSRVRHDNIITLFGISAQQQAKYLIMEYAEGGSLHNFLHGKVKPYYSTAHAISWARQCAEGVSYLHAMKPKPLIHRDLKPLNLLLTNKGRHLKICDFGTVADKSTLMTNNKGSAAWMAPEVFEGMKYTEKCDIFSWAIVLWEVLSRQQPFKGIDNTYSIMWKIHKGERPPLIQDCPAPIQNLMTSCWATVPDLRPSMQRVLNVMNELASSFPGADEPLEYKFENQQIIRTDSNNDTLDNYTLDFSSFTGNNTTSTQVTPTDQSYLSNNISPTSSSTSLTPTNIGAAANQPPPMPTASIAASVRWGVEMNSEETAPNDAEPAADIFRLTPSAAASARYAEIQNDMQQQASNAQMPTLSVDVDPNAWNLDNAAGIFARSDGLTVSDNRPNMESNSNPNLTNVTNLSDDDDDDEEDDENDGPDQSFHEMLDPELQPEEPISNNSTSQKIYRQHRRLAKEYLRVDTELYYAQEKKESLLKSMNAGERQEKQELLKKMSEKEELLSLYNTLKQQLDKMRADGQMPDLVANNSAMLPNVTPLRDNNNDVPAEVVSEDDWVVIQPQHQAGTNADISEA